MTTIFKIIGGGQKVRQNVQLGLPTEFIKVKNSDWVEKSKCNGQSNFTNVMWSDDLDSLQRWANEWAGSEVELIEVEVND